MRVGVCVVLGVLLAWPAAGQTSEPGGFRIALEWVRSAGRIIAKARHCINDHERIIRAAAQASATAERIASFDKTQVMLLRTAIVTEYYLVETRPDNCPQVIEAFVFIEQVH